jgi:hypothetical protein
MFAMMSRISEKYTFGESIVYRKEFTQQSLEVYSVDSFCNA